MSLPIPDTNTTDEIVKKSADVAVHAANTIISDGGVLGSVLILVIMVCLALMIYIFYGFGKDRKFYQKLDNRFEQTNKIFQELEIELKHSREAHKQTMVFLKDNVGYERKKSEECYSKVYQKLLNIENIVTKTGDKNG